jgi:hypothetical protein
MFDLKVMLELRWKKAEEFLTLWTSQWLGFLEVSLSHVTDEVPLRMEPASTSFTLEDSGFRLFVAPSVESRIVASQKRGWGESASLGIPVKVQHLGGGFHSSGVRDTVYRGK